MNLLALQSLLAPMRSALPLVLLLAACSRPGPEQGEDGEQVVLRVVDRSGRVLPEAVLWTMPSQSMKQLHWLPYELAPYAGNPHELLCRLGRKRVADASGIVRVPCYSVVAGEHAGLAGTIWVGAAPSAAHDLVLDDWRWTIVVKDKGGMPVAGVPVSCESELADNDRFEGIVLGMTDAEGRLVVRDPNSVHVESYVPTTVGSLEPEAPKFVRFEVDGMYLEPHAKQLSLQDRESGTVMLTLPPVTKVEVRLPEGMEDMDIWPTLTRVGKGVPWDNANCWAASGKHFALVGFDLGGAPTPIAVMLDGHREATWADVPLVPAEEVFVVQMRLAEDESIARARVLDPSGRPASSAVLQVSSEGFLLGGVRADQEGRVAIVIKSRGHEKQTLEFYVGSSATPDLLGARGELVVEGYSPGDVRDCGAVTLRGPTQRQR